MHLVTAGRYDFPLMPKSGNRAPTHQLQPEWVAPSRMPTGRYFSVPRCLATVRQKLNVRIATSVPDSAVHGVG
ncbi:hypothetical protein GWI33_008151 [Rhynchophorus ferrugineus]|uniref:Uncharacterized protein n=1 Tax=Rhynchophorus ferrugineus TaxID=354439 RepID=A0A834IIR8_RHYFE|nr:hypothetical protein GWI33_008151 [Rhynchophorus ferrugineus]